MAKVILLNGWNSPAGFYRRSLTKAGPPVDIPDHLLFDKEGKSQLPSSARIVDDDYVTPALKLKPDADTFSEHRAELNAADPVRMAAVAQAKVMEKADADRAAEQAEAKAKFDAELAAEKAAAKAAKPTKKSVKEGRKDA